MTKRMRTLAELDTSNLHLSFDCIVALVDISATACSAAGCEGPAARTKASARRQEPASTHARNTRTSTKSSFALWCQTGERRQPRNISV
jgi:hypothetical protein